MRVCSAPYARIPKVLTYAKTNCLCVWPPFPPPPSRVPPFSPPPASCARRVAGLTRIIFTAYHRLNIDLRMVSSSVWTSTRPSCPPLFLPVLLSRFPASHWHPGAFAFDWFSGIASSMIPTRRGKRPVKAVLAAVWRFHASGNSFSAWIYGCRLLFAAIFRLRRIDCHWLFRYCSSIVST